MSRSWVFVFLLLIIGFTSQFEWMQQLGDDFESSPNTSHKENYISKRRKAVKEKIILTQEKTIQKLSELVQSLREQVLQCKGENEFANGPATRLAEFLTEPE